MKESRNDAGRGEGDTHVPENKTPSSRDGEIGDEGGEGTDERLQEGTPLSPEEEGVPVRERRFHATPAQQRQHVYTFHPL